MIATNLIDANGTSQIAPEIIRGRGFAPESYVDAEISVNEIEPPFPMEIPPDKTLQDILDEYEVKYGMASEECFKKLENDEIDEEPDLLRWMGFYRLAQSAIADGENPEEMKFTRCAENHAQV